MLIRPLTSPVEFRCPGGHSTWRSPLWALPQNLRPQQIQSASTSCILNHSPYVLLARLKPDLSLFCPPRVVGYIAKPSPHGRTLKVPVCCGLGLQPLLGLLNSPEKQASECPQFMHEKI